MSLDLRPLTLGELLDRSVSLYRRHFWLFVGIMALPSLLGLGFGVFVALFNPQMANPESAAAVRPAEILGKLVWFAAAVMGMMVVYFVTYTVALGATTVAVSHLYLGRQTSIRDAYAPVRGRVGRLALLMILISIRILGVVGLVFVSFVVAGGAGAAGFPLLALFIGLVGATAAMILWLWMALRYAVSVPAALLENRTASDAIRRSIELTRGSLLRVFVLLIFTMIVTYAVLAIFQGPFVLVGAMAGPETSTFFWFNLLGTITGSLGGALTSPLMIVAFAVLYYDLRVRHEGLDLQIMLDGLGSPVTHHAPPSLVSEQGQ